MDHYETLGLTRASSGSEIRSAYRIASLRAHPDKGGTAELFARVQTAYTTLSNPELRRAYDDRIGACSPATGTGTGTGTTAATMSRYGYAYARGGVDVEVHGQVQREPCDVSARRDGARAGQHLDDEASKMTSTSTMTMTSLTDEVERLRREMVARPADRDLVERVASAHLDRAEHHLAAGRWNHASFDAYEAELLRPDRAESRRRLRAVLDAVERGGDAVSGQVAGGSTDDQSQLRESDSE